MVNSKLKKNVLFKFTFLTLMVISIISCEEENAKPNDYEEVVLLEFISLKAKHDTVSYHESTLITAEAYGTGLSYKWVADGAGILGAGRSIELNPCPGSVGELIVECTVADTHDVSETKSITIVVVEPE